MSYRVVDDTSRRVIDVAIGILVGLRGCSDQAAFDELVRVVHQTGIGIGRLAADLRLNGRWAWIVVALGAAVVAVGGLLLSLLG